MEPNKACALPKTFDYLLSLHGSLNYCCRANTAAMQMLMIDNELKQLYINGPIAATVESLIVSYDKYYK